MAASMSSFRYRSTQYYLLPTPDGESLLAFDAGWPCSLHEYARAMKATGNRFEQIKWMMVSHFHLDHAGLVRDFQDAGIVCLLFENQGSGIDAMERTIMPKYRNYRTIDQDRLQRMRTSESRAFLASIGIHGEVIQTPGHSDDSVSLVTDSHDAMIGDLYPVSQIMPDDTKSHQSWRKIRELGGMHIFPSHAMPFELDQQG
ncbi:MAG TPA: MBL fold metallo-hydrolase [bacterium]|nr:MBL fold metallo-hydrolase [bacterium]